MGRAALKARGPTADLLRRALGRKLDASERACVGRIERARMALEKREDEIPFEEADGTHPRQVGELCRTASKSARWAELLFRIVRSAGPERCLELGSCVGVSAAYQGAALELNGAGRLITVEGRPAVADIASRTIEDLGLVGRVQGTVGWFGDVLDGVLADLGPVDYAFIDGHHEGEATLDYFRRLQPSLARGAVVIVDDIAWSSDMHAAWAEISGDAWVADPLDLGEMGICRHEYPWGCA